MAKQKDLLTAEDLIILQNDIVAEFKRRSNGGGDSLNSYADIIEKQSVGVTKSKIPATQANNILKALKAITQYVDDPNLPSQSGIDNILNNTPNVIVSKQKANIEIINDWIATVDKLKAYQLKSDTTGCGKGSCQGLCLGCTSGCSGECYSGCSKQCGGDCGSDCSNGCYNGCFAACGSYCRGECWGSCVDRCAGDGCTTLQHVVTWEDGNGCSSCSGGCVGTCHESCYRDCSGACYNSCRGGCAQSCATTGCKNSCTGVAGFAVSN